MSVNTFAPRKYEDFEILGKNGAKVGEVRIKPSGILWAPKGSHKWFGVDIDTFAEFVVSKGKPQKK